MKHPTGEQLSAWLDNDLPAETRASIDDHLQRCEHCRGELLVLRSIIHRAREEAAEWSGKEKGWKVVSSQIAHSIVDLRGPQDGREGRPARDSRRRRMSWRLLAAGVVGAAMVSSVFLVQRSQSSPGNASVEVLLQADGVTRANLGMLSERGEWGTPSAREAIAAASLEIDRGLEALERVSRERPNDPAVIDLLERAITHRRQLLTEVTP